MPDITDINGVALSSITDINGVAKANITDINGISAGASGGSDIAFSDITYSSFDRTISSSNPFDVDLPTTAASGDFVMVFYAVDFTWDGNRTTTPSGWTLIQHVGDRDTDVHIHAYTRVFDGTEGSTVPISPQSLWGGGGNAWSMVVENIDTSDPVGAITTETERYGYDLDIPAATSAGAGTFVVFVGYDGADGDPITSSNDAGFTLTVGGGADVPVGGGGTHVTSGWRYSAIGANTSTGDTTISFNRSDGRAGMQLLLQRA